MLGLTARLSFDGPLPDDVAWLVHTYGLLSLAALTVVEHEVRDDPDMEELLRWPLGALGAVCGVLAARLLAATSGEFDGVAAGTTSWLGAAGAAVASVGVVAARRRALETLDEVATLEGWWRRVEAGGVVGILLLIWALPFLAIILVVVLTVTGVAMSVGLRRWRARVDAQHRQPCPRCQAPIRQEASRCPKCRAEITPRAYLAA